MYHVSVSFWSIISDLSLGYILGKKSHDVAHRLWRALQDLSLVAFVNLSKRCISSIIAEWMQILGGRLEI